MLNSINQDYKLYIIDRNTEEKKMVNVVKFSSDKIGDISNWEFDKLGFSSIGEVYGLFIEGSNEIQGLISLEEKALKGYVLLNFMEASPHRNFKEVGRAMCAYVVLESIQRGHSGRIRFLAKDELIPYYKKIKALQIGETIEMHYTTHNALQLLANYLVI